MRGKETQPYKELQVKPENQEKEARIKILAQRLSVRNFADALHADIAIGTYLPVESHISRKRKTITVAPLAKCVAEKTLSTLNLGKDITLGLDSADEVKTGLNKNEDLKDTEIEARRAVLSYRWTKPLSPERKSQVLASLEEVIRDTDRAQEEFAATQLSFVESIVSQYIKKSEDYSLKEELIAEANMGLVKVMLRFDWRRGNAFSTYATLPIHGEIKRFFRDKNDAIQSPRDLHATFPEIFRAKDNVRAAGKPMTTDNLYAVARSINPQTTLTKAQIDEVLRYFLTAKKPVYFDRPLHDETDETIGSIIPDEGGITDYLFHRLSVPRDAFIKAVPSARNREILYRYYIQEQKQREIGAALGLSQYGVSRIIKDTLTQLRAELGED